MKIIPMRKTTPIIICLFFKFQFSIAQVYSVSMDDRNSAISLLNEAQLKIEERKANEAILLLTKGINTDSTLRESYILLFKACLLKNDLMDLVKSSFKKGKRVFLEDDEIIFYLGEVYRLTLELDKAEVEYTSAIMYAKTNGEDFELVPYYYFNRGNCHLKNKLYDQATLDYDYCLKLKPGFSSALVNRGFCFYKKGKLSNACSDWCMADGLNNSAGKEYCLKYCKK
jgi:tetratricopeptide (TPR) repeat protein